MFIKFLNSLYFQKPKYNRTLFLIIRLPCNFLTESWSSQKYNIYVIAKDIYISLLTFTNKYNINYLEAKGGGRRVFTSVSACLLLDEVGEKEKKKKTKQLSQVFICTSSSFITFNFLLKGGYIHKTSPKHLDGTRNTSEMEINIW